MVSGPLAVCLKGRIEMAAKKKPPVPGKKPVPGKPGEKPVPPGQKPPVDPKKKKK